MPAPHGAGLPAGSARGAAGVCPDAATAAGSCSYVPPSSAAGTTTEQQEEANIHRIRVPLPELKNHRYWAVVITRVLGDSYTSTGPQDCDGRDCRQPSIAEIEVEHLIDTSLKDSNIPSYVHFSGISAGLAAGDNGVADAALGQYVLVDDHGKAGACLRPRGVYRLNIRGRRTASIQSLDATKL